VQCLNHIKLDFRVGLWKMWTRDFLIRT